MFGYPDYSSYLCGQKAPPAKMPRVLWHYDTSLPCFYKSQALFFLASVKFEKVRNLETSKIELFTVGENAACRQFDFIVILSYPCPKSRTVPAISSPMPPTANVLLKGTDL